MTPYLVVSFIFVISSAYGLGTEILPGNVYIEFIGALYVTPGAENNQECNSLEAETVQNIQAIKWTLEQVNKDLKSYTPSFQIGLRVSQTCKKDGEDKRLALQLVAELQATENYTNIVALIGSDYSSETEAISRLLSALPDQFRLLQVGFSSTSASLSNREIYKNFFRTIPPDNIQVEVMHKFIEKLNWTYMAMIYDSDTYGTGGINDLMKQTTNEDICFPVTIPVDPLLYNASRLEEEIESKIINATTPISGILVFGSSILAKLSLTATNNVIRKYPNQTVPVFLFSEAGAYIQGHETDISKGAFILSPPRQTIQLFEEDWYTIFQDSSKLSIETQNNPWLREAIETRFDCSVANNTCIPQSKTKVDEEMPSSVYNQYAIQATMVIVKLVKEVFREKCPTGSCSAFFDTNITPRSYFVEKMAGFTVNPDKDFGTFRISEFQDPDLVMTFSDGSPEVSVPDDFSRYEVYNHQICNTQSACLVQAARYTPKQSLEILKGNIKDYDSDGVVLSWPNIRKPQCPDGYACSYCLAQHQEESMLFYLGDVYVVGVVPIHNKGASPLKCGTLKQGGVDIVEVIRFAVGEAQTALTANIGVIIIDSCNDPQIIQEKILTLHRLGVYVDGEYVAVQDKILGYIGGWTSDVSRAIAEVTSRLKYPQISYASTATSLSDRKLYPFFLRVPSSDRIQAQSIIDIVRYLNANVIQILYSESVYGIGGRDLLLQLAKTGEPKICVAQTIAVTTSSDKEEVLRQIRTLPSVQIVVLFLASFDIEYLVDTLNTIQPNEFLFISSEGWGTRLNITSYTNLVGSITLTSQLTINAIFEKQMLSLSADNDNSNLLVRPYLEKQFNCYYQWNYNKSSNNPCSGEESLSDADFRIEAWAPFAERAVYTLLEGARVTLGDTCNRNTGTLCQNFWNNRITFLENIKAVQVKVNGFDTRVYDDNGDGQAGYRIYQVALNSHGAYYKNIDQTGTGPFSIDTPSKVNSTCNKEVTQCTECFPASAAQEADDSSFPVGVIVVIVILGIVCCALAGILLFICNRHGCCIKIENGRPKFTNTYLTPIYMKDRAMHGVEGSASPFPASHYDSIPNSSCSRVPTTDGSASITGSQANLNRMDSNMASNQSRGMMGFDNFAFDDVSKGSGQQTRGDYNQSSSGIGTLSQDTSFSSSERCPEPHRFQKTKAAPEAPRMVPPASSGVVFQPDGSYITTASANSVSIQEPVAGNASAGSIVSTHSGSGESQNLSNQSLGYLRNVQTTENRI